MKLRISSILAPLAFFALVACGASQTDAADEAAETVGTAAQADSLCPGICDRAINVCHVSLPGSCVLLCKTMLTDSKRECMVAAADCDGMHECRVGNH